MEYLYKLSIITVNLNNREGLQKTIDSVINQTCQDFEWIIIDGGSVDGSKELIEKYSNHINYWVSETDKGIYNAMNKGIINSHGKFLIFLNSGDYFYDKNVIKNCFPYLKEKDIYVGKIKIGTSIYNIDVSTQEAFIFASLNFVPHPSTFINKKLFYKYSFYNENLMIASDWEFFYKISLFVNIKTGNIPLVITVFELDGISSKMYDVAQFECNKIKKLNPGIYILTEFYRNNYEKIKALNFSSWLNLYFRVGYYIFRKIKKSY